MGEIVSVPSFGVAGAEGLPTAIVVGAGIIGLATAWELAGRGWEVTVVDPAPGHGATEAAAGMLTPISEVTWDQPTLYPLLTASDALYPDWVARVEQTAGTSLGYLTNETLICAADAADRRGLLDIAGLQHELGMPIESISGSEARRLEPALGPGVVGAMRIAIDHQIDPRKVSAALIDLVSQTCRLVDGQVSGLLREGDAVVGVRLADGRELRAGETLVAAGLGTGDIAGLPDDLPLPVRPVWGDILHLRVPERLYPLITRMIRGVVHGLPVYLVPREDNEIILGATAREGGVAGVNAGGVHQLLRDAERLVPGIAECEVTEMMARARPGSPDDAPMIGRVGPGLTVSTGFFRHGILLTPLAVHCGATLVTGGDLEPDTAAAVDPHRFDRQVVA